MSWLGQAEALFWLWLGCGVVIAAILLFAWFTAPPVPSWAREDAPVAREDVRAQVVAVRDASGPQCAIYSFETARARGHHVHRVIDAAGREQQLRGEIQRRLRAIQAADAPIEQRLDDADRRAHLRAVRDREIACLDDLFNRSPST